MHYTEYPTNTKEYRAAYMRDYRHRNPEREKAQQIKDSARRLVRLGYTVVDPNGNPVEAKSKE